MAVINRNTLVLQSVSAGRGVVTGTVGMGFDSASGKTTAIPFSMRPPSHHYEQAGQETRLLPDHAARRGVVAAANRAGRSACSGVLASRSLAWPLATGGSCPTAARRFGRFTAKHLASVGNVLSERLLASRAEAPDIGNPETLPYAPWAKSHVEAGLAGVKPAGGALPTSARGSGF